MRLLFTLIVIPLSISNFPLQAHSLKENQQIQFGLHAGAKQFSVEEADSSVLWSSANSAGRADATSADIPADEGWALALDGTAAKVTRTPMGSKGTGRMPRVIRGVANDGAGGVFISGSFFGEVELGSAELISNGWSDVLVGRIDSGGRVLWLHSFGGRGTDISPDVVADSQGRALLTGMVSAGAQVGEEKIETLGGSDAFTAQLSPEGNVLWLQTVGGKAADSGNEIAIDEEDNVLVAANSYGMVKAGNTTLKHRGGMDGFLLKYNASGELHWVRQIAGPADEQMRGIATDRNGNVAVVGEFTDTVDVSGEAMTAASGQRDAFVARYTPRGALLWSQRFGGLGEDYARGVDIDESGNLYVTGVFSGSVNFGDITLESSEKKEQLFILRLSPDGEVQWARGITGSGSGHGCELDVNQPGHVLIGCDVMGELGVDGKSVESVGRRDSFVAVFDTDGNAKNLVALGTTIAAANFDIVGDSTGRLATLVGVFEGALVVGNDKVRAAHEPSSYIARLALEQAPSKPAEEVPVVSPALSTAVGIRYRDSPTRSRRGPPGNPDPDYTGASAGPYVIEARTTTIPAQRWQEEMSLRIYAPIEPGPYPVIVFCAGSGGRNDTFRLTSNYLASHGYVVIHNSYKRQRGLGNENLTRNRVLDVGLVLDALEGFLPSLEGKIDKDRVGAMGHSSGAYITQLLGGAVVSWGGQLESFRDPRIHAILMYSGQGSGQQGLTRESWQHLSIPMMVMTGSGDRGAFSQEPSWRREPFDLSGGPGKYLLWYDRGHHGSFSGNFARNNTTRAIFEHAQKMTLAFFDAYLKSDGAAQKFLSSSQPKSLNSASVEYFWR